MQSVLHAVDKPKLPYTGLVSGGFKPGMMVHIHGDVLFETERFYINLQCGASVSPRADIAFHFNPRFAMKGSILNSLYNDQWGTEVVPVGFFPFAQGQYFEIIILILVDQFKVAVNGQHYANFNHRMDLQRVDTLYISGKINVKQIRYEQPPTPEIKVPIDAIPTVFKGAPILQPELPYVSPIPGGIVPGRTIIVNGVVSLNPNRFAVNLQDGHHETGKISSIALHFNPRFPTNVVVLNTKTNGNWGWETVEKLNPFQPNQQFELIILCGVNKFKIAVNGKHFTSFKYKIPITSVDTVTVSGNVRLTGVRFQ